MSNTIKLKRGAKANLPILAQGEPAFTTDTNELFVGNGTSNIKYAKDDDINKVYTTTNSGNVYSVTIPNATYTDGRLFVIKFNAASTGAITLNINSLGAKNVIDYNGNQVSDVRANLIVNLRYEANSGNFILLGKGGGTGTATSDKILNGYTATTNSGQITGIMPNRGVYQYTGGIGSAYDPNTGSNYLAFNNIPPGYYYSNNDGWSPEIRAKFSNVANAIGLTADKLTRDATVLGITGTGYAKGATVAAGSIQQNSSRNYLPAYDLGEYFNTGGSDPLNAYAANRYLLNGDMYICYGNNSVYKLIRKTIQGPLYWTVQIPTTSGADEIKTDGNYNVYFTSMYSMYSYDSNGELRWSKNFTSYTDTAFAVARDGTVYLSNQGNLYKYDTNGNLIATLATGQPSYIYSMDVESSGNIYVGYSSGGAQLRKYNSSGTLQWTAQLDTWGTPIDTWVDKYGNVYCIGDDNLRKYNSAGAMQWSIDVPTTGKGASAMCLAGEGEIIFLASSMLGGIVAYNPSGTRLYTITGNYTYPYKSIAFDSYGWRLYTRKSSNTSYAIEAFNTPYVDNVTGYTILS